MNDYLNEVKRRIGIAYTEPEKDAEISQMIAAAIAYFKGAGWDISAPTPLAIEAVALYCKMAQSTDTKELTNHPVLVSFISQGRCNND